MKARRLTADIALAGALLLAGALMLVFLDQLVAKPQLLFGRALSAIQPTLFPTLILSGMVVLSAAYLITTLSAARDPLASQAGPAGGLKGWLRIAALFAILIGYALAMKPLGFFISTAATMFIVSLFIGNRNILQALTVSLGAPILLYLGSTRLLRVSLPELSAIEFAYAWALGG